MTLVIIDFKVHVSVVSDLVDVFDKLKSRKNVLEKVKSSNERKRHHIFKCSYWEQKIAELYLTV